MNTRQLQFLVTCARTGSIAAAARELGVAQPSISQQIANLEHELRSRLLERDHRGVVLTDAGQRFLPVATSTLAQLNEVREQLRSGEYEPVGRVTIGMNQPTGNALAVPLYKAINDLYPGIELDLTTGLSSQLFESLRQGEVDLLLTATDASDHMDMISELVIEEQLFLAVGTDPSGQFAELLKRKSIRFTELANYPVMFTSPKDSLGYLIRQYEIRTGVTLQRQNPFGQLMTSLNYVMEGYGLLICPSTAISAQLKRGEIHALEIVEPQLLRQVDLVRMQSRPINRAQQLVAERVRLLIEELSEAGIWKGATI